MIYINRNLEDTHTVAVPSQKSYATATTPAATVRLVEVVPSFPPNVTDKGREVLDLLCAFQVPGYSGSFVTIGHPDTNRDATAFYAVFIVTQEDGFQAYPGDIKKVFRFATKGDAVRECRGGPILGFAKKLTENVPPAKFDDWVTGLRRDAQKAVA